MERIEIRVPIINESNDILKTTSKSKNLINLLFYCKKVNITVHLMDVQQKISAADCWPLCDSYSNCYLPWNSSSDSMWEQSIIITH